MKPTQARFARHNGSVKGNQKMAVFVFKILGWKPKISPGILFKLGCISCAIQQTTPKRIKQSFSYFHHIFFNKKKIILQKTTAISFLTHVISAVGGEL
jgi:hypothetical protein